jgi:myo-inositol 2-dehydrogenase/D-chiro-inositol 1-dehydrogenase/scyllo-inositol 2-dehydrogenase (NAD+)
MINVRICLIGAGRAGEVHGDVYNNYVKKASITAIVDIVTENAKKLARKYELKENYVFNTLEDAIKNAEFDAVIITTPTFTHVDYAIKAAKNHIHVFCEKPMATTINGCDNMIKTCSNVNVKLQIGFMRRFDPDFVLAKKIIDEGTIGIPVIIKSLTHGPGLPGKWAFDIKKSNGMLAEVSSHDFDTIRWFAGAEYKQFYAIARNMNCPEIGKEFSDFYDTATVLLTLNNGTLGIIDSVCPCDYGYDARAEVIGSKGVMFIGSLKDSATITCIREKNIVINQTLSWRKRFHEAYIAEDRHFVDCILNDKEPLVSGLDGKKAVEAVIASNKSILRGQTVNI